jgi:hypothetical protein
MRPPLIIRLHSFENLKRIISILLIFFLTLGIFLVARITPAYAAASLYLSPAGKTVNKGDQFSIAIRVNTGGDPVNAVEATITYPTAKLSFGNIDYAGSGFEIQAEETVSGNIIRTIRGTVTPKNGDKLVATVTFKAKASGKATVSFTSDCNVVRSSDNTNILSGKTGGTYTIKDTGGDPGGDPGGTPQPSNGSTPTSTSTSTATSKKKGTTAPIISDIKVVSLSPKSATITWKTNEKSTSIVEYGIAKGLGFIVSDKKMVTSHKLALSKKLLSPGSRIYYMVRSKDAAGNVGKSKVTSFKTKGYTAKIRVLDLSDKPVKSAKVTLVPDFDLTVTDEAGFAVFTDIAPGKHSVNVEVDGQTVAETITVEKTKDPSQVQNFEIKIAALATTKGVELPGLNTVIIIGILAAVAAVLFWLLKFRIFSLQKAHGGSSSSNKRQSKEVVGSEDSGVEESKEKDLPSLAPDSFESKKGPRKEQKMKVFTAEKEEGE